MTEDFSELTLGTSRLELRPLRVEDAPSIFATRSDPQVMRYHTSGPWSTIELAHALIARDIAAMAGGEYLRLGLTLRGDTSLIGSCCLFDLDRANRRGEIGYELHRAHWGRGYMHEALQAMLDFAFTSLLFNRIEADIHPDNLASARALERLSFQREGLLRERWIVDGEVSDTVLYGLLHRDWLSRQ